MSDPSTSTSASSSTTSSSSSSSPQSSDSPLVGCVPCQHISVRNPLTDFMRSLWCGFTVTHRSFTFFYSGDTAYCEAFKQIGQHSPHIDLAILPIGAYEPWWSVTHCTQRLQPSTMPSTLTHHHPLLLCALLGSQVHEAGARRALAGR